MTCLPELEELMKCQQEDDDMAFNDGICILPEEEKLFRHVALEKCYITKILCFHAGRWCMVVPKEFRKALLEEAHRGRFAGHLAEKKVYDRLKRYLWWKVMKNDVSKFCKASPACASQERWT
jgi:hypothetical protein